MQQHCTELTQKLLKSIDKEYNVVDMGAVVDVLTALEKTTITKEVLESTRLGKHINNFRRQTTNDALAKRAKDLVRKWRDMLLPPTNPPAQAPPSASTTQTLNGTKPQSPGARVISKPRSPTLPKNFKPQSPFLRDGTPSKVLSPALSLNSDQSRSPNPTPIKQLPTSTIQNNRLNQTTSPILSSTLQNHTLDAVPRTHSSNKRLRKDETATATPTTITVTAPTTPTPATATQYDALSSSIPEHNVKKQRINGENLNININTNSKVPSPIPINTKLDVIVVADNNLVTGSGPKKRGRKKGSKSLKNQQLQQDRVKEKLASISRNPKLKTTQELLADLQARGSSITSAGTGNKPTTEPPTTEEILRVTDDNTGYNHNNRTKLINSTSKLNDNNYDTITDDKKFGVNEIVNTRSDPTVEEILAKLPPIDHDSIRWSDNDDYDDTISPRKCEINDDDVDRFHNECIEGLNGNYQLKLNNSDDRNDNTNDDTCDDIKRIATGIHKRRIDDDEREFKEWHEMLARPSYGGQILHILPYVIID